MARRDSSDSGAQWSLHHLGVATADAKAELATWAAQGYTPQSDLIHDPLQLVRVMFLRHGAGKGPLIELVEPASESSPVQRYIAAGPRFYHLCFEVPNLESALQRARGLRWLVVKGATPAAAFDQRPIAWCYTGTKDLVELLQA